MKTVVRFLNECSWVNPQHKVYSSKNQSKTQVKIVHEYSVSASGLVAEYNYMSQLQSCNSSVKMKPSPDGLSVTTWHLVAQPVNRRQMLPCTDIHISSYVLTCGFYWREVIKHCSSSSLHRCIACVIVGKLLRWPEWHNESDCYDFWQRAGLTISGELLYTYCII